MWPLILILSMLAILIITYVIDYRYEKKQGRWHRAVFEELRERPTRIVKPRSRVTDDGQRAWISSSGHVVYSRDEGSLADYRPVIIIDDPDREESKVKRELGKMA